MSAVRVVRAFLYRDRDCLLVFFVGVIFLGAAATEYLLTDLLVAAAPVVMLASFVAVSCVTSNAARRVVGQWGGAGGAICEDHFILAGQLRDRGAICEHAFLASVLRPLARPELETFLPHSSLTELTCIADSPFETIHS